MLLIAFIAIASTCVFLPLFVVWRTWGLKAPYREKTAFIAYLISIVPLSVFGDGIYNLLYGQLDSTQRKFLWATHLPLLVTPIFVVVMILARSARRKIWAGVFAVTGLLMAFTYYQVIQGRKAYATAEYAEKTKLIRPTEGRFFMVIKDPASGEMGVVGHLPGGAKVSILPDLRLRGGAFRVCHAETGPYVPPRQIRFGTSVGNYTKLINHANCVTGTDGRWGLAYLGSHVKRFEALPFEVSPVPGLKTPALLTSSSVLAAVKARHYSEESFLPEAQKTIRITGRPGETLWISLLKTKPGVAKAGAADCGGPLFLSVDTPALVQKMAPYCVFQWAAYRLDHRLFFEVMGEVPDPGERHGESYHDIFEWKDRGLHRAH